ncbi:MAG: rod shape-determining protein MreC [Acidobacteriaceae bacterium]|nr:rod shape-determining protein MreC [Acidobacteriaceae bacterium]
MEALLSRYRNLTVLLVVVVAQLLYLAYQVRTNRDERLIRVWAVTAVTPMAGAVETIRRNTIGFLQDYFILLDVREQNRKLKSDNDRLRLENVYFRNQLRTAEHATALTKFQAQSPSKTIAARVIGNSTVATAKAVFIDRGSTSEVEKGMAVVTPDGIVGKVVAVYPLVSQVLLITDPTFKVGVESQKNHIHGVLNCGGGKCSVEQIQNEDKLSAGEWFFTSGEDRIFPKGFPVGTAVSVQPGQGMKDVKLNLSGAPGGAEEVLVVLQGAHQAIPAAPAEEDTATKSMPAPPAESTSTEAQTTKPQTEADKIREKYDALGKEQKHEYGSYTSNVPNFNLKTPAQGTQGQASPSQAGAAVASASPAPKNPEGQSASARNGTLGSSTAPTAAARTRTTTASGPVLPLGAPRHKAAPASGQNSSPTPVPPQ